MIDRFRRLSKERREEQQRALAGPEPICGCGHHLAYHDLHDGRCYAEVKRNKSDGDPEDRPKDTPREQCRCRRYAGPEPLATLYAPQLTSSTATTGSDSELPPGP
ncbi:hypothetical protein [Streptacidiphilus sp. MAP12-20]|uniref:hypothetical protein n=1 Tax=Streptacidiphilus sp. MAP12-20 TaxID=3156299 RepID=UPI003513931E